jgi:hypothetical protein
MDRASLAWVGWDMERCEGYPVELGDVYRTCVVRLGSTGILPSCVVVCCILLRRGVGSLMYEW